LSEEALDGCRSNASLEAEAALREDCALLEELRDVDELTELDELIDEFKLLAGGAPIDCGGRVPEGVLVDGDGVALGTTAWAMTDPVTSDRLRMEIAIGLYISPPR
jgi:hypothetical protein